MANLERENQKKNIEYFFRIINASPIRDMSITDLTVLVLGYFDLLEAFKGQMPFLEDLSQKRQKAMEMISSSNHQEIEKVRSIFTELQATTRRRLEAVIKAMKEGKQKTPEILSSNVRYIVFANLQDDKFVSVFESEKISVDLDLESELKCLDIVTDAILVGYGKKPSQLGECEKSDCSNLFFKYTPSTKFCSTRCSNAAQQATLRKNRKRSATTR